jgi:hypothetical protein
VGERIHLAQDRDRRRAVVNAVMNLRVLAPRSWLECTVIVNVSLSLFTVNYFAKPGLWLVLIITDVCHNMQYL